MGRVKEEDFRDSLSRQAKSRLKVATCAILSEHL